MTDENSTVLITNIYDALNASDQEAQSKSACLVVVGGDLNGTLFELSRKETSFGRSPECTITMELQGISRKHFEITKAQDTTGKTNFFIQDLGSSNGTFVNNNKVLEKSNLSKGDIIKIGTVAFKYIPEGDPERLAYDKLHEDASMDGLTKCFNKSFFNNACELEIKKSKITGSPISIIMFDLDHFKKLNDTYGHDAGDYVLKELAQIIRNNGVREGDIFARYGGEEFVILLPKTNLKQSFEIAERMRRSIESFPFSYEDQKLVVTSSIGIADYADGVESGTDLFKRADQALYQSKSNGRNQVSFYKP